MIKTITILLLLLVCVSMSQVVLPYKEGFKYKLQLELVGDDFVWIPHPVKDEGGIIGFIKDKIIIIISLFIGVTGVIDWFGRWKKSRKIT